MRNRKSMGIVVATLLFLIIAVGSVVGFQSWYQSFQSRNLAEVSEQSFSSGLGSRIEVVTNTTMYFNHVGSNPVNYSRILVGNVTCEVSGVLASGVNSINLSNCNGNISNGVLDVSIVTDSGLFHKKLIVGSSSRDVISNDSDESISPQNYDELILSDNPVSYWNLDDVSGIIEDLTGESNGTSVGTPSYSQPSLVQTGNSISFGNGVYFTLGNANFATLNSPFSVELWMNFTGYSCGNRFGGLVTLKSDGLRPFRVLVGQDSGKEGIVIGADEEWIPGRTGSILASNQLYHIVVTYNGLDSTSMSNFEVYINNVSNSFNSFPGGGDAIPNQNLLGLIYNGCYFPGRLDNVAIYDYELSANQVSSHYSVGING